MPCFHTCTPIPMHGKPKLEGEEEPWGGSRREKVDALVVLALGRVGRLDVEPWVPHNSRAGPLPWQVLEGEAARPFPVGLMPWWLQHS